MVTDRATRSIALRRAAAPSGFPASSSARVQRSPAGLSASPNAARNERLGARSAVAAAAGCTRFIVFTLVASRRCPELVGKRTVPLDIITPRRAFRQEGLSFHQPTLKKKG